MKLFTIRLALLTLIALCNPIGNAAEQDFARVLKPFFTKYCWDCHGDGTAEGGLDLSAIGEDLADEKTIAAWIRVYDRVRVGEMPPKDATQPSEQHRDTFTRLLGDPLTKAHAASKGTVLRRLNRREYQNTMNDMFGTHLDLVGMLPEDGRSHEFDNVGEALSISLVQMQRYLDAADRVLDAAIVNTVAKPQSKVVRASYADTRGAEQWLGSKWLKRDDGAVVFFTESGYPSGMLREANVNESGFYKVRVTGYAHQSDQPVTFSIGATTFARGAEQPTFGYYSMPPGEPTTIEVQAWIESRYMIQVEPYGLTDRYEIKNNGIENYNGPGLAILHVEVEGPIIEEYPSRGHRLLFDGITRQEIEPRNPNDKTKSWYKPKYAIESEDAVADVKLVLQRVATRAFRRPVNSDKLTAYVDLFKAQVEDGATIEEGLRTAISALLCSPDFIYLSELPGKLDDYALASRLSYFLTRTLPDEELLAVAQTGKLSNDPATLREQTERLLNHEHAARFITDFADAWLDLRNIDFTSPDRVLFPEFEPFLQYSIVEETRAFLRELLDENLPVKNIVKSDFAMLNNRLAEHYEIEGVVGPEIRRVALPPNSPRGGILSQASILKVSANGTNTSPVVRGVWVMERILGQAPPPPPAGVGGVEPDIRGAKTLRELLDKHRDLDTCRSCHQMIDPPGFALESFNPVGGWRDRFRSTGEGERINLEVRGNKVRYKLGLEVDASGELPDGREFSGFLAFRELLAEQEDLLAKALATKLLIFATGREMGFSDRAEIERIVRESAAKGHGVRELIHLVVMSEAFRFK
ncbi:MAG: DUF1592 domain-containing protein [Planctomycetaceae bacterium]|nr:DUF1592 domain-containing protein [Planctomycetaceae bacterium]